MLYLAAENLSLSFGNWTRAESISYRICLHLFAAWLSPVAEGYMLSNSPTTP